MKYVASVSALQDDTYWHLEAPGNGQNLHTIFFLSFLFCFISSPFYTTLTLRVDDDDEFFFAAHPPTISP